MYKATVRAIKSLKIQGAQRIALKGAKALTTCKQLSEIKLAAKELGKARPTEPCLRNALRYASKGLPGDFSGELRQRLSYIQHYFSDAQQKIAVYGARRIKQGNIVFTHCHSSTVVEILKLAKAKGRHFSVHNTETRPFYQGRITARELVKAGIKVTHFVDAAARMAIKKANIMLIGADAVTSDGFVVNKIGSEMFAEIANAYQIPVYACTLSWKFDPATAFGFDERLESRFTKEVWAKPPKNLKISNVVFEKVHPRLITGIISELGIHTVYGFIEEVKRAFPWIS